jgi:hypothetical protein
MLRPLLLHHPSPAAPYLPASSPHRPPPGRPVRRSRSGYSSLFSPSSLEGYSPSLGHLSGASSSFADVVKGKGKVSAKGSAPDPGCSDGKGKEPVDRGMVEGSFMADACQSGRHSRESLVEPPPITEEGWQLVSRRRQWRRLDKSPLPLPQPRRLVPADLID